MNEKSARSMPYKGISVGLFFSCFEKIGKQQETRKRHILPITRRGLQPKRQRQTLSPPGHPFLPTGTNKGNSIPILLRVPKCSLIQACPTACLMAVIHNLATPYQRTTCPPRCKRQTSTANHRKGNRFPPTWPTTQSRRL